ncbi:MAG: DUF4124 domain-containing protein [Aeromonadaceae bacterium]|nr:DUF4124 domain-containing protein [Aeromonadaceae bacterium]
MNHLCITRLTLPTVALLWLFSPVVSADIYTCVGKDGVTAYQDRPCAGTQQQKSHQATPNDAPLGGYESCEDMRVQLFEMEDGFDLVREDMANFGWSTDNLRDALQRCNLPTSVADAL